MRVQTGVVVAAVQLQDVDPPKPWPRRLKTMTNAKEDPATLINQAQGYRNDITPKAKGEAAQLNVKIQAKDTTSSDIISKRIESRRSEDVLYRRQIRAGWVRRRWAPNLPIRSFEQAGPSRHDAGADAMSKQGSAGCLYRHHHRSSIRARRPSTCRRHQKRHRGAARQSRSEMTEGGRIRRVHSSRKSPISDKRLLDYDSNAQDA